MSKKKTDMEMREIAERIKEMAKYWNENDSDDEDETENEDHKCCDRDCENCIYWDADECCCAFDKEYIEDEEEEDEEEDEEEHYRYPECDYVDGECDRCEYRVDDDHCELDDEGEDDEEEEEKVEELSKFIMSVGAVLGRDMGLLVFDKSNKKDMEKLAAIFGEYAKRLS